MFSQTFYIYNVLDDIDGEDSDGGDGDMGDANPYGAGGDPYGGGGGGYGGGDPYGESNPSKSVLNLGSVEEIKKFIANDDDEPAVVGFFDESTNASDKEAFEEVMNKYLLLNDLNIFNIPIIRIIQVASKNSNIQFALTTSKEVLEEYKYDGCAVLVFKPSKLISDKYEKVKSRYPSKTIKSESLEKFIYDKSYPLVGSKSYKSSERFIYIKHK